MRRLVCDSATILNLSASSFFFLIHFFNDSLVVFGISVLSVHSRHLQSSLRHNREEGTELDRKGREGKGREGMRREFFVVVVVATILFTRVLVPSNQ